MNHIRLFFAVIFLSIISLLFLPISFTELFSSPLPQHWLWFGASGVIGLALGDYFGFTSFVILGPRIGSIFTTLAPAAAFFAGFFIIGERINVIGVFGILITITGVVWLTLSRSAKLTMQDHQIGNVKKGILFATLAAVCQGVGVVLANKGFQTQINNADLPFFQATWIRMISATTIIYTITIFQGKLKQITQPVLINKNNGLIYTLLGTIFGPVIGVSLSMLAVSLLHNKPSVAQTIFSLVPVFVLPLSYLFYKEKITIKSILGALIAITGVIILIWRDAILSFFI
ncbi:MAG: DMT family transporter [Bacteroidetes bacterium]|nr:DMT family transporter [Bacteroidota bacterium]